MAETGVTGRPGDETSVAVLAFEKWTGRPRDGVLGARRPEGARAGGTRPSRCATPRASAWSSCSIASSRSRSVNDRVDRVFHISSGAGGRTPSGSFRVYRKERLSWSVPFFAWMPWATYFTGGIAFHEYGYVPAYPASHGCVRMMARDAPLMYAFATTGTPVDVLRGTA